MLQSKNEFYVLYEFIEFYEIFVPTEKKIEKADGIILSQKLKSGNPALF